MCVCVCVCVHIEREHLRIENIKIDPYSMSPAQRIRESSEVVEERGGDGKGGEGEGGEGGGQGKALVPLPNVRKVFANLEKGESDLRLQADVEEFVRIRHGSAFS